MSYTHNTEAQYRDNALQAREEVSEGRKEFYKLFGASGFSLLAAAACGGGSGSVSSGSATPGGGSGSNDPFGGWQDYSKILGPNAAGWKYLSAFHDDYAFMNYGTTGSIPVSVLQDLADWHRDVAYSPAGPLSWQVTNAVIRADASKDIYGCVPQEMICSFNTTDGMIKTITGIKWNNRDIILMTNNEHGGGLGPIHMVANRYGLSLIEVPVPTGSSITPGSGGYYEDGELIDRFEALRAQYTAAGRTVRAIMISSPPYTLGWRLEESKFCKWAWEASTNTVNATDAGAKVGILTIVDGAHIPGAAPIDLHKMGCDYFAGTAAKWQCGPGQTGYAYVRMGKKSQTAAATQTYQGRTVTTNVWENPNAMEPFYVCSSSSSFASPTSTTAGWQGYWDITRGDDLGGAVAGVGNPNYPTLKILYEVNKVWHSIGRANIAKYDQNLAQYLRYKCSNSAKMGPLSLGVDYRTPNGIVPGHADFPLMLQTGLTLVNPFGPNKDVNDDLTWQQSAAQASASRALLGRILSEYGIVIRNISTKHQLRSDPSRSAQANKSNGQPCDPQYKTNSTPLRISTHLYTTVSEVDRLVDGLNAVL